MGDGACDACRLFSESRRYISCARSAAFNHFALRGESATPHNHTSTPHERENALDDEQRAPVAELQDVAGDGAARHRGEQVTQLPDAICASTLGRREPVPDEQQESRKYSAFEYADRETNHDQLLRIVHKPLRHFDRSPQHHQHGDQRLAVAVVGDPAAHDLRSATADKQHARRESENRGGQPEFLAHRRNRKADVGAIHERDDKRHHHHGQ